MTNALDEIFASNPKDKRFYRTLELSHSAFTPVTHRIVQGFSSLTATLEANAPYDAGQSVVFEPAAFDFVIPEINVSGRQDLTCKIFGASFFIAQQLELSRDANREPIKCTIREFESGDLSAPASQPITLTVLNPQVEEDSVSFRAVFADVVNKQFPSIFYTLSTHPGLAE